LDYYRKKGLSHFWIKKATQKIYLDFCSKLANKIIQSKNIKDDVKIIMTLNHGQEVINFITQQGLDQESLNFVASYSQNINQLVKNISKDNKTLNSFLKNVAAFEHAAGTAMICGLMARKMNLETDHALQNLGIAATLHDIGLTKEKNIYEVLEPTNYLDEVELEWDLSKTNLSESRKKELKRIFEEHPIKSAEICKSIAGLDDEIIQIIAHHHERIDGSGFPNKLSGPAIHPLAQVLAIADEFCKLLRQVYTGKTPKEQLTLFPVKLKGFSLKTIKVWE
jgi:putative nucleotidyltransferase with HDIG domain